MALDNAKRNWEGVSRLKRNWAAYQCTVGVFEIPGRGDQLISGPRSSERERACQGVMLCWYSPLLALAAAMAAIGGIPLSQATSLRPLMISAAPVLARSGVVPVVAVQTRGLARPAAWKAASRKQHPQQRKQQRTMVVRAEAGSSLPKRESRAALDTIPMNGTLQQPPGGARLLATVGRLPLPPPARTAGVCAVLAPPHPLPAGATLADKRTLLDKVDCFIFDCDGVIWRGDSVIEGVPETLDMLRDMVRGRCCQLATPCTPVLVLSNALELAGYTRCTAWWLGMHGGRSCRRTNEPSCVSAPLLIVCRLVL